MNRWKTWLLSRIAMKPASSSHCSTVCAADAFLVVLAQESAGAFAARFVDDEFAGAGAQQARAGGQVGSFEGTNQHVVRGFGKTITYHRPGA
jgi:hypothetical protein